MCICDLLEQPEMETNNENLNDAIVTALYDNQKKFCPKTQKDEYICENT